MFNNLILSHCPFQKQPIKPSIHIYTYKTPTQNIKITLNFICVIFSLLLFQIPISVSIFLCRLLVIKVSEVIQIRVERISVRRMESMIASYSSIVYSNF